MLTTQWMKSLGIRVPIIQAGMAGKTTNPQLVAAVSNAGGLGTLGAGYMAPEAIRTHIRAIRALTEKPFAVNLFIPQESQAFPEQIERTKQMLQPHLQKLGISSWPPRVHQHDFEKQVAVLIDEKIPVFSFTFGIPAPTIVEQFKRNGTYLIGTATTTQEAIALEKAGMDAMVAQGSEAGGHRGTFQCSANQAMIGTMALIPQVTEAVQLPVIAAGGIMDGRGIAAALALGAAGVQMGTAFLTCLESTAHPKHKEELLKSQDTSTSITKAFTGKEARGIRNEFMQSMASVEHDLPPYPIQNDLTAPIRKKAEELGNSSYMSLWSGQGASLCQEKSAEALIQTWMNQLNTIIDQLACLK